MTTTTSYHISNLGKYSTNVPRDLNGYVHLTADAWLSAPLDISAEDRADAEYMQQWAEEQACAAREATDAATAAIVRWQQAE